ncbi:MAG: AAA family ATPase [Nitrolancea sp.]
MLNPHTELPPFVGRERERNITRAQLSAALAGQGGLVVLSGEAGIGKTTLAEDVCQEARAAGALVLIGHCYDRTETPPYGPWAELLEQYQVGYTHTSDMRPITEPNLSHSSSQASLFNEMRTFLVSLSRERPLVVVLEDVHWADNSSLDLLRVVARQLASSSILLLVTYRSDEVSRQHPLYSLLPMLIREALAVRIDLSPLSDDDVRALIEQTYPLPAADTQRLSTYLQSHAEGNPFFVAELLRSLEGSVLVQTYDSEWSLGQLTDLQVPIFLRQVIDARIAKLGTGFDTLLALAATIGQVVPLSLWATVGGTTEKALLPLIERAIDAQVLDATPDGLAVRFSHALIRGALYEAILPPRRRAWHRVIGEQIASQPGDPDPDAVAYHFTQASDPRAADWLTRAGERAQRSFAWGTAAHRFESALALLQDDPAARNQSGWLRFHLALLRRFQDPSWGTKELVQAEQLGTETGDAALIAYARYFQGMLRRMTGEFQHGTTILQEGISLLDALSLADHARLAAFNTTSDPLDSQNGRGDLTLTLGETGRFAEAVALGEQIVKLPPEETFGSSGDAFYGLGYAYAALGQVKAARSAFSAARKIFKSADHRNMVLSTLFDELVLAVLPYHADQPLERERLEAELREAFATIEDIFEPGSDRVTGLVSRVLEGEWSDAVEIMEQNDLRFIRLTGLTLLAPLAFHQGDRDRAWSLVREGLPSGWDTERGDSAGHIVPLRALTVMLSIETGDLDAARRWLDAFDHWLEWSGGVYGQADVLLCRAAFMQATGDLTAAREHASQALIAAGAPRQPLTMLASRRLLGELDLAEGRLNEAETQLTASLKLAETCHARHEQALTLLALARLFQSRGDIPSARAYIAAVRDICTPMGATLTLEQADELDANLIDTPSSLPAGLTPREGEVLKLLATGLSNAEIADRLSLSIRTIHAHLTTIYSKLGVSSRGAAIRFALDHDLG